MAPSRGRAFLHVGTRHMHRAGVGQGGGRDGVEARLQPGGDGSKEGSCTISWWCQCCRRGSEAEQGAVVMHQGQAQGRECAADGSEARLQPGGCGSSCAHSRDAVSGAPAGMLAEARDGQVGSSRQGMRARVQSQLCLQETYPATRTLNAVLAALPIAWAGIQHAAAHDRPKATDEVGLVCRPMCRWQPPFSKQQTCQQTGWLLTTLTRRLIGQPLALLID